MIQEWIEIYQNPIYEELRHKWNQHELSELCRFRV